MQVRARTTGSQRSTMPISFPLLATCLDALSSRCCRSLVLLNPLFVDSMTCDASHTFIPWPECFCLPVFPQRQHRMASDALRELVVTSSIPSWLPMSQARSADFDCVVLSPFWPQSRAFRCGSRFAQVDIRSSGRARLRGQGRRDSPDTILRRRHMASPSSGPPSGACDPEAPGLARSG